MDKKEQATQIMLDWMENGFDLKGERNIRHPEIGEGEFDSSSSIILAWTIAGVPVRESGATYTGNMEATFLKNGFVNVTNKVDWYTGKGLERGDVLVNYQRCAAMALGDGKLITADAVPEYSSAYNEKLEYQFAIHEYWFFPWDCILRYDGE